MLDENTAPEVRTANGRVRGRVRDHVATFRGIPYAQPPTGRLRFAAPAPASPWDGVREAAEFGSPAPQAQIMSPGPAGNPETTGDDWLTVNVWTPQPDSAARLPVMVWIHGGGWMFGHGGDPAYDGTLLAREGGVVLVTCNYRLGMEGWALLEGAPANRGLLDQIAALEWVRENISGFGGDPHKVTVFGQSAGAGSVAALLAAPRARGLFRRAIAESVTGSLLSPELAADISGAVAAELGLRPIVTDLAAVDPEFLARTGDLVAASLPERAERWGAFAYSPSPYSPVVDGAVLPRSPWEALAAGAGRDIELLTGHTRDEFRTFAAARLGSIGDGEADAALSALAPEPGGAPAFRAAYPGATAEELYLTVTSDWLFRMPSLHLAECQSAGGGAAYVYELTWRSPGMGGALGAPHILDTPLVFGTFTADPAPFLFGDPPSPRARALSELVRARWAAFARGGDPGWPEYVPPRRVTQILDNDPVVVAYPEDASRRLWERHRFDQLPLASIWQQVSD
ncbi:carboxylesterase/lipase family protein [Nocardia sp. NPDC057668]|uniref:carboxylesterase/lipase family protein n=1 Tax=Nocardia sp. NPDC057668 TaxID=3346202 RepID=UPI003672C789